MTSSPTNCSRRTPPRGARPPRGGADAAAPDVLDEVIATVLAKRGRVVCVEDRELASHGRIALILRY